MERLSRFSRRLNSNQSPLAQEEHQAARRFAARSASPFSPGNVVEIARKAVHRTSRRGRSSGRKTDPCEFSDSLRLMTGTRAETDPALPQNDFDEKCARCID